MLNLDSGLLFHPITKTWPRYVIVFADLGQADIRDPHFFCKAADRLGPNLLVKLPTCEMNGLIVHKKS